MIKGTSTVKLSRDFTLEEMLRTSTGLPNDPIEDQQLARMVRLCTSVLQPIRNEWGPLKVTSGFRSPAVNAAVGGSATSQHLAGEAVDFIPVIANLYEVYRWIAHHKALAFGTVIWEKPPKRAPWIHVALPRPGAERKTLVYDGYGYKLWGGV